MEHLVSATFSNYTDAESALSQLESIGITDSQISIVVTDETRGGFNLETHSKTDEGVASGFAAGGIVGAALGALMVASSIVVPGLNLVVTGALAGALTGLATGATAGGLVGGLIGAGMTEYEAKMYEKDIKNGATLIAVKAVDGDQKKRVKEVFKQADAYHLAA